MLKLVNARVAVTTGMIVIKDRTTYEFSVTAPVETILEAMTKVAEEKISAVPQKGKADQKASIGEI